MRFFAFFRPVLVGGLMGAMLVYPREAAGSVLSALRVFAAGVLPALLPFAVFAPLAVAGRTLPAPLLTLLALPGGSPTGARLFAEAGLTRGEAKRAAARTGGMSPMFFLATLAGWLDSVEAGRMLLLAHVLAGLLVGCFFRERSGAKVTLPALTLSQAVAQGAQAMVTAAGCAAVGAVCARMIGCALRIAPPFPLAVMQCVLEITSGMKTLISLHAPLPLLSALTGFTGVSILLQNAFFWQKSGLTLPDLIKIALLRAGLSAALCQIFQSVSSML